MRLTPQGCRAIRLALGLSQQALANRAYVSSRTVQNFEDGRMRPTIATLTAIDAAVGSFLAAAAVRGLHRPLTAEDCRKARALLGWSQKRLGAETRLNAATIRAFERGGTRPHRDTITALRRTFEAAGLHVLHPWGEADTDTADERITVHATPGENGGMRTRYRSDLIVSPVRS